MGEVMVIAMRVGTATRWRTAQLLVRPSRKHHPRRRCALGVLHWPHHSCHPARIDSCFAGTVCTASRGHAHRSSQSSACDRELHVFRIPAYARGGRHYSYPDDSTSRLEDATRVAETFWTLDPFGTMLYLLVLQRVKMVSKLMLRVDSSSANVQKYRDFVVAHFARQGCDSPGQHATWAGNVVQTF